MEEISREGYLAYAGHKHDIELRPIYERHAGILGDESLRLCADLFRESPDGSEAKRSARYLLEWQMESHASRALAELDEREVKWENDAFLQLSDGSRLEYQSSSIEISNEKDRDRRLAIDEARAKLVSAELAPLKQEHLQRERGLIDDLGIASDYNSAFEAVTGVSLSGLRAECEAFLRDTQAMWDDTLPPFLRKSLGIKPSEARRSDALALFRASEFDAGFPGNTMESSIRKQVIEMGADPTAQGRVVYDLGEREGKRARAFCSPVRVPEEVYLVLRPHGGQNDYNTMLHELGHALHFANAEPDLEFEYRWLGDNSVTEAYAMLFDHRMQDRGWLLRYTELGKARSADFLRMAGFEELHFLRRYCAKLIYEVQLYAGGAAWTQLPDLYRATLTAATTFQYQTADAFVDVDPRYYSARYLRAWQLQSLLDEHLVSRFDSDWYRNPAAGPWITRELFASGQRSTADEVAGSISGRLSFAPLIARIEKLLAG